MKKNRVSQKLSPQKKDDITDHKRASKIISSEAQKFELLKHILKTLHILRYHHPNVA